MTTEGTLSFKERQYRSDDVDDLWLVNKPYKYNDIWTIWPNTILNSMEISDCNDTINGVCLENQTLDECINRCTGDCGAGVYFKFHDGKSICVPIRTAVHPTFNPIYRLRKQAYYDIKDVDVSVFVNTELFPNPPNQGNAVLYFDIINIASDDKTMINNYVEGKDNPISMTTNLSGNVQIVPQIHTVGSIEDDIPLKYGDKFNIIIPGTNLTITNKGNKFIWSVIPLEVSKVKNMYYTILPLPHSTKKIGDVVTNRTPFTLVYNGEGIWGYINLNTKDELEIDHNTPSSTFNIISQMIGNYCDNGSCIQVPIKDIIPSTGTGGKYKDSNGEWTQIYRHKGCWNRCGTTNVVSSTNSQSVGKTLLLIIIVTVFAILLILLILLIFLHIF